MLRRLGMLICALVLIAAAAPARAGPRTTFVVSGDSFEFALPDGFCFPDGHYEEAAKKAAAADDVSLTLVSFADCSQMRAGSRVTRFAMIKTPKEFLNRTTDRAELLAALRAAMEDNSYDRWLNDPKAQAKSNESIRDAVGPDVRVSTDIKVVGVDEFAAYHLGVADVSMPDVQVKLWVAVSVTVIKGRQIYYFSYQPMGDAAGIPKVLRVLKAETMRLVKANGG